MKYYKEVEVPEKTVTEIDYATCDICQNKIMEEYNYSVNEVEVCYKSGAVFHDGGYGDEVEVDMCGKCFEEKLVPWVEGFGGKVSRSEWNY